MVMVGHVDVDENKYPDLALKEYMVCQSKALSTGMLSFVTGGAAGYIITQLLPKVYPKYPKLYNMVVITGSAIITSYFVSSILAKQCQRRYLLTSPRAMVLRERHDEHSSRSSETFARTKETHTGALNQS